jgi:Ca2+-binding EF-hand superfamily protein
MPPAASAEEVRVPNRVIIERALEALGDRPFTRKNIARVQAMNAARQRAREMEYLLAADYDNDGALSAEEITQHLHDSRHHGRGALTTARLLADRDGDGMISPQELRGHVAALVTAQRGTRDLDEMDILFRMDTNGDGLVDPVELRHALEADLAQATPG